jgi:hypothetical protein
MFASSQGKSHKKFETLMIPADSCYLKTFLTYENIRENFLSEEKGGESVSDSKSFIYSNTFRLSQPALLRESEEEDGITNEILNNLLFVFEVSS